MSGKPINAPTGGRGMRRVGRRVGRRVELAWRERGYALVSLLAGLTIMLVLMAGSIPAFQHEIQREREEEMFWRGQQVSWALLRASRTLGRYPTKLEDLAEKFQTPTGEMRFLRQSALCDPMFKCPNEGGDSKGVGTSTWRAVRRGDPLIRTFYQAYLAAKTKDTASGLNRLPPMPQELAQLAAMQGNVTLPGSSDPEKQEGPPNSEFASDLKSEEGPIYGVVSRYDKELIRNYFELASYDEALFFSGVAVAVSGLINPIAAVVGSGGGRQQDPRCPQGGMWFEEGGKGFCAGVINQGKLCRDANGQTVPCADLPK